MPYKTPEHFLDVDILARPVESGKQKRRAIKLRRLSLRWATGEKKGEVATLEDLDPGVQHGTGSYLP